MSSLRGELNRIHSERGRLTPALVVEEWRAPEHPFHARLEWEDSLAAEAHRRRQAQELIRSVRVEYRPASGRKDAGTVRAYQAVRSDGEDQFVYEPAEVVASDPFLTGLVLRDMEREWKQLKARYGHFQEFVAMVRESVA